MREPIVSTKSAFCSAKLPARLATVPIRAINWGLSCATVSKPFMVVTQMLDSMHERAVPTRAEVLDIYNAVLDGASSLMLTGETAAGSYPAQAVEYLVNIETGRLISASRLPERIRRNRDRTPETSSTGELTTIAELERQAIAKALRAYGRSVGGKEQAARALGISKATLYRKLKEYDLVAESF